jgi:hypothetical protein
MNTTAPDNHAKMPGSDGRLRGLAAIIVLAAIGLTACGSSSTPQVASLPTSSTAAGGGTPNSPSTTAMGTRHHRSGPVIGNATALLVKWASCMNTHGDPNQAAPTIDANKVIHLTWNDATPGGIYGTNKGGQGNAGPGQYCRAYINEAITELQDSQHRHVPSQAQFLKFSQCMRANGIPDFPDPSDGGLSFNRAGDLNPSNPTFRNASTLCAKQTGVPGFGTGSPQPGSVVFNGDPQGGTGG